jgi:hypothetical protein
MQAFEVAMILERSLLRIEIDSCIAIAIQTAMTGRAKPSYPNPAVLQTTKIGFRRALSLVRGKRIARRLKRFPKFDRT